MFKKLFYLDLRSLAFVRFSLGLLVFYDFYRRIPLARTFYSDEGILSRSVLMAKFHHIWKPTLLFLNGTHTYAIILLVIGMAASLFYALGIRTRLSNFIAWVILISFQERFRIALNGGDVLLVLCLFWSFFLPMGARVSWDQAWLTEGERKSLPQDHKVANIFTLGWFTLIFYMYLFTFFYKWHPDWFKEGTTLYYALNLQSFTTGVGRWLLNFPALLKFLSISTLWLEGLGPLFLLIPFRNHLWRYAMIVAFCGLHLGIGLTMTIGTFAFCCCLLWLPLLPSEFWDWTEEQFKKITPKEKYQVFYDKDCGFCRRMVLIFSSILGYSNVEILSSEVDEGIHKQIVKENSWAGRNSKGEVFFRWANFLELLAYSPLVSLRIIFHWIPLKLGDGLYNIVAGNRLFFTQVMNAIGPSKIWLKPGRVVRAFGVFLVILIFWYNLDGITKKKIYNVPRPLRRFAQLLRLNQKWNMFAPYPTRVEGWLVVDGSYVNGKRWDPWRKREVSFKRPHNIADEYTSNVWRKVLGRVRKSDYEDYRLYLGKYICRTANDGLSKKNGERLQSFKMYYMKEYTPAPGEKQKPPKKSNIWNHDCFKKTKWPN